MKAKPPEQITQREKDDVFNLAATMEITLDGEAARLVGRCLPFAEVYRTDARWRGAPGYHFAWQTAMDILTTKNGAFTS